MSCLDCPAGSYCPPQSSNALACPAGQYSLANASACTPCPAGRFGASPQLPWATCSGTCPLGTMCPVGSTAAIKCSVGRYSNVTAASECLPCPVGRYGNTTGLTSSTCTGLCSSPGYICPLGSVSPQERPCPAGTYSATTGSSAPNVCISCPSSDPYSPPGSNSSTACVACSGVYASPCADGTKGKYPCANASWAAWTDGSGVEGANSCLIPVAAPATWAVANASCGPLYPGAHLLTTKQVRCLRMQLQAHLLLVVYSLATLSTLCMAWLRFPRWPMSPQALQMVPPTFCLPPSNLSTPRCTRRV